MLKYLWTCQYNDGRTLSQNQEDVSTEDPKRSMFFDVVLDRVIRFWITDQFGNNTLEAVEPPNTYLVDLTDGHFEVNGAKFFYHEITLDPSKHITNRRLIYKMRNWIDNNGNTKRMWMLGWQGNYPDGENVQRYLMIE